MARVRTFAVWLWLVLPLAVLLGAQLGEKPSELEVQQRLRTSMPESEQVLLAYVDALRDEGRTREALESAKNFAISHPDSQGAHRALLFMYGERGQRNEALQEFDELGRLEAVVASDLVGAAVLVQADEAGLAATYYERALELDANNFEAHANLATILIDTRRWGAAREHLAQALNISTGSVPALLNLGILERRAGRPQLAIEQFENVLRLEPSNPLARQLLRETQQHVTRDSAGITARRFGRPPATTE